MVSRDMLVDFCRCFSLNPSVSSLIRCMRVSKQDFYKFIKEVRTKYNVFFVPNLVSSKMVLAELEDPKIDNTKKLLIDLNAKKRAYFYIPLPSKGEDHLSFVIEEMLKTVTKASSISLYSIKMTCHGTICLGPRKVVVKPSWGETLVSLELTENLLFPKEMASRLAPLTSWQKTTYLLRGALQKGLLLGPVCRTKDRTSLTVLMDIEINEDIFELKGIPYWVEDSLVVLKKLNSRYEDKNYALIFSVKPYHLNSILNLNEADALSFKIKRLVVFTGGTRILPSLRNVLTLTKKRVHPVELYANVVSRDRNVQKQH